MLGPPPAVSPSASAGTAAAHAIQYPVGALTHTPHGVGVGALLPYVMEFNRPARVPELAAVAARDGRARPTRRPRTSPTRRSTGSPPCWPRWGSPPPSPSSGSRPTSLRWTAEQAIGAATAGREQPAAARRRHARGTSSAPPTPATARPCAKPVPSQSSPDLDRDGRCPMTVMDAALRPVADVDRGADRAARGGRLAPRRRRASAGGRRPGDGLRCSPPWPTPTPTTPRRPSTPRQRRPPTGRRPRPAPAPTS